MVDKTPVQGGKRREESWRDYASFLALFVSKQLIDPENGKRDGDETAHVPLREFFKVIEAHRRILLQPWNETKDKGGLPDDDQELVRVSWYPVGQSLYF